MFLSQVLYCIILYLYFIIVLMKRVINAQLNCSRDFSKVKMIMRNYKCCDRKSSRREGLSLDGGGNLMVAVQAKLIVDFCVCPSIFSAKQNMVTNCTIIFHLELKKKKFL